MTNEEIRNRIQALLLMPEMFAGSAEIIHGRDGNITAIRIEAITESAIQIVGTGMPCEDAIDQLQWELRPE